MILFDPTASCTAHPDATARTSSMRHPRGTRERRLDHASDARSRASDLFIRSRPAIAPPVAVLVADPHPMIVQGLRDTLAGDQRLRFAGQAGTGREAVDAFRRVKPHVVVLDLEMPEEDGLAAMRRIRAIDPCARIVVFTSVEGEEDVRKAVQAGATGYLLKTACISDVVACILTVASGRKHYAMEVAAKLASWVASDALSDRELQILRLVAEGHCNKTIARAKDITEETTKSHLKHIFRKLGVSSRTAAVHAAMKRGVVRLA